MQNFTLPGNLGGLNIHSVPHGHESERKPLTAFGGDTEAIPDGNLTDFYVGTMFAAGSLCVYINGVLQEPDETYSEMANGTGYTIFVAPKAGTLVQHAYRTAA